MDKVIIFYFLLLKASNVTIFVSMQQYILLFAGFFGVLAIILGAFGAHLLKKKFTKDQLESFETGVRYQIYHALLLLIIGLQLDFSTSLEKSTAWLIIIGVFFFSFSIYGLTLSSLNGKKWRFLGPITPLGGLLLIAGWICLTITLVF